MRGRDNFFRVAATGGKAPAMLVSSEPTDTTVVESVETTPDITDETTTISETPEENPKSATETTPDGTPPLIQQIAPTYVPGYYPSYPIVVEDKSDVALVEESRNNRLVFSWAILILIGLVGYHVVSKKA
jgi:hypothetical protein